MSRSSAIYYTVTRKINVKLTATCKTRSYQNFVFESDEVFFDSKGSWEKLIAVHGCNLVHSPLKYTNVFSSKKPSREKVVNSVTKFLSDNDFLIHFSNVFYWINVKQ